MAIPTDFEGPALRDRDAEPCLVDPNLASRLQRTMPSLRLEQTTKDAIAKWDAWWKRYVATTTRNPPSPPPEVSKPFAEIAGLLFDLPPSEVSILTSRDQRVPDRLSLDFFNRNTVGEAGALRTTQVDRLQGRQPSPVDVVLTVKVDSFSGSRLRSVLSSGIHEAAHYRHHLFTSDLIEQWLRGSARGARARSVSDDARRLAFSRFLDRETTQRRISNIERAIVHSALDRRVQVTHPFAQLHAFLGTYHLHVRERAPARQDPTVLERFEQLFKAADAWRSVSLPGVAVLAVRAVAEFARQDRKCTIEDLEELTKEIAARPNYAYPQYFKALAVALAESS